MAVQNGANGLDHTGVLETRRKILYLIKAHGCLPIDEMARHLGITLMAVRKHIAGLERSGLITGTLEKRPKGRPRYVYSLTDQAACFFPQIYTDLLVSFLDDLRSRKGSREVRDLFEQRAGCLRERYRERLAASKDFEGQVLALANARDEDGFMADCRREGEDLILEEHNCPLICVASQNHEACDSELALFQELLGEGVEVRRESWIAAGDHTCTYRITQAKQSS